MIPAPVEIAGPYGSGHTWRVLYEGKSVPNLHVRKDPDCVWLVLDERMEFHCENEAALKNAVPIVANAMAFGAGYPCFGVSHKRNEYNVPVTYIASLPSDPDAS